jgi:hypothetical protein
MLPLTMSWLPRFDGTELMGTEGAPDGFCFRATYPFELPWQGRAA